MSNSIQIAHLLPECRTLGPDTRGIVWVSGCSRKCKGCIAEPLSNPKFGTNMDVAELADKILFWENITGITFSGGEPFDQAESIIKLCNILKSEKDLSLMSYTGYHYDDLLKSGTKSQQEMLSILDILVDGPFIEKEQSDVLWRGSSNQKIYFLTERHSDYIDKTNMSGVGVEIYLDENNNLFWAGIPPKNYSESLKKALEKEGLVITDMEEN